MNMNDITTIIANLGFPIFVAVWMLNKSSKDNEKMTSTINDLKNAINILTSEIKHHNKEDENE